MPLQTRLVTRGDDIRTFFDGIAGSYGEAHGRAARLLAYRLALIRRLLQGGRGTLVEIGCGPGTHLFPLADDFDHVIGTDLSSKMIAAAKQIRRTHPCAARIALFDDPAECLDSVRDGMADVVLCVGALEHMPDKLAVLRQVRRVMKPQGRFVCLTPNGDYLWYRRIAPRLGLSITHLSSDRFVDAALLQSLLRETGLRAKALGYWRFIPKGDMPGWAAQGLEGLDRLGQLSKPAALRGGLYFCAERDSSGR